MEQSKSTVAADQIHRRDCQKKTIYFYPLVQDGIHITMQLFTCIVWITENSFSELIELAMYQNGSSFFSDREITSLNELNITYKALLRMIILLKLQ